MAMNVIAFIYLRCKSEIIALLLGHQERPISPKDVFRLFSPLAVNHLILLPTQAIFLTHLTLLASHTLSIATKRQHQRPPSSVSSIPFTTRWATVGYYRRILKTRSVALHLCSAPFNSPARFSKVCSNDESLSWFALQLSTSKFWKAGSKDWNELTSHLDHPFLP